MTIFWRLVLAHLLTDFTLQTNFVAKWKRDTVWGCVAHSLVFLIAAGLLCYDYLTSIWVMIGPNVIIYGWMAILFLTIFHFFEDQWRIWTIQKLNTPDTFGFFLWDQFIHIIFIFVLFPIQGGFLPERWIALLILFVLTTHFTTIFIYYLEKNVYGRAEMPPGKKYVFMIERVLLALSLLLPGIWGLSFIVILTGDSILRKQLGGNGYSKINGLLGNLLALVFGFLARFVYY